MISNKIIEKFNIFYTILKYRCVHLVAFTAYKADDQLIELCNNNQNNATFKENSRETISLT